MDLIALFIGLPDFSSLAIPVGVGELNIGVFITAVITFLITALVVYLAVVKPYNAVQERMKKDEPEEDSGPTQEELLTEIRDALTRPTL